MSILVAQRVPDFTAAAVLGNGEFVDDFRLYDYIRDKYAMVFFYPLDFTFVCPSELIALDHRIEAFNERGVSVLAVSIDSKFTHHAWRNTPVEKGGIGPVRYPMIADVNHAIAQSFGIEHPEAGLAFRATFIIDKNAVVRSQVVNDLPIGRDIDEFLRLIDALQFHDQHGEVCPAGWRKGQGGMKETPQDVARYLSENSDKL